MASPLENLQKILLLEKEKGYQDTAVIGGLERWLANHEEAQAAPGTPSAKVLFLLQGYGALERAERARRVGHALELLRKGEAQPTKIAPEAPRRTRRARRKWGSLAGATDPARALDGPITNLSGVSRVYAQRLARLGVESIRDLLYLFPRRHEDFSALKNIDQLRYGEEVTVVGTVWETQVRETRGRKKLVSSIVSDGTSTIEATWFNKTYLTRELRPGRTVVLSGKVEAFQGRLTLESPEWEPLDEELVHTGRLVPIYPLTEGVTGRWLRRLVKRVADQLAVHVPDPLPQDIRVRRGLLDLPLALQQAHFPESWEYLAQARERLAFDEFLLIQLGVLRQRARWQAQPGRAIQMDEGSVKEALASLPFALTQAQARSLREILADMARPSPMRRLLQGDVGSGKTIVALLAMLIAAANGLQAVLMAPTEILAEQHLATAERFLGWLKAEGFAQGRELPRVRLLSGKLKPSERKEAYEEIAEGRAQWAIGTHALIEKEVEFAELGLVIIDEQHRFGVAQRAALRQKGIFPDLLVMSATPIPRTLALTIYGDLDISVIDELPPGRQEILTRWRPPEERSRAYAFLRSQVAQGRQGFIICPLIEESEAIQAKAATVEYERLRQGVFPDLRLGLLHGRLKAEEKERAMEAFRRGDLDILVSTPVVEVGIDIPNATVMLVEGADRFGLAQLHQFRGRVGRGEHKSYCILISEASTIEGKRRLAAIEELGDGFKLAEVDLEMRGRGEFFGTRQSGLPDLKLAKLADVGLLMAAREEASRIIAQDPELTAPHHRLLTTELARFWKGAGDLS